MTTHSIDEITLAHISIDWSESACAMKAKTDPAIALLFDEPSLHPERARIAKSLCLKCPILATCLGYALEYETPTNDNPMSYHSDTLLGGYNLEERRKLKRLPQWQEAFGLSS